MLISLAAFLILPESDLSNLKEKSELIGNFFKIYFNRRFFREEVSIIDILRILNFKRISSFNSSMVRLGEIVKRVNQSIKC